MGARKHRVCREAQKSLLSASTTCKKLLRAVKANETLLCNRESLTAHPSDLVSLCEPSTLEPLGMWLKDMMETFAERHTLWQKDSGMCQEEKHVVPAQEDACRISQETLKSQEEDCDGKLDKMQTLACSWVTGFASRCTSYDICFAPVRTRHADEVRQTNVSVQRWKKSWLAASRMECMPWTVLVPWMRPKFTLARVRRSRTCRSSRLLFPSRPLSYVSHSRDLSWIGDVPGGSLFESSCGPCGATANALRRVILYFLHVQADKW